jgi:aminoglycoside/choline kinase family phosphotransferase/dTDP-glucose pyrophosphorylase
MKALILAAGLGTRLLPYTRTTPKPLFTLAGRTLLEIHIRRLCAAGCEAVIVNTHHLHSQIEAFIASRTFGIPVVTRFEPAILGTGGAIRNAADFWDERPFLVINADIYSTVDLRGVYEFHLRHQSAATLVLCDDPRFNSVRVDSKGFVRDFVTPTAPAPAAALTFTGIQVLDPLVLQYLPPSGFFHSIDAYRALLADGKCIRALIADGRGWIDLGTPERYRRAAREASAFEAWRRAFPGDPRPLLNWEKLEGDGSDREWFRLRSTEGTLIMADHGLRETEAVSEADAFIHIGRHLKNKGLPVPTIFFYDAFAGLVFLEDLGDLNLQKAVAAEADREKVMTWYRTIIDDVIDLSVRGGHGFDPGWAYQTPAYDRRMILERECRYFCDAFLNRYTPISADFGNFKDEFNRIADNALEHAVLGFMHRDMQSRNIMLKEGRFYFIDFQGGRLGPLQYDLAALLIDPYVSLTKREQELLLEHAISRLSATRPFEVERFRRGFVHCALARNLQILGAFGFLSTVKGKTGFTRYIPAALRSLEARLEALGEGAFPKLHRAVTQARQQLEICNE